jgi:uncharacterized membrane protein
VLLWAAASGAWALNPPTADSSASPITIRDYDVTMGLQRDATVQVVEAITVDFGTQQRHGVYRRIPVTYSASSLGLGKLGTTYGLRVHLLGVQDERGDAYDCKVSRDGPCLMIRIGDPDRLVSGTRQYRVAYSVSRAVLDRGDVDELYWNVTGCEWEWPIQHARCTVTFPHTDDHAHLRYATYSGEYGATGTRAKATVQGDQLIAEVASLAPGEGLTVALGVPKGTLSMPASGTQALWFLLDNSLWIGVLLFPLIAFGAMLRTFLRYGRDPQSGSPVTVQYEPPPGLTPAEVGTLVDERADNSDIVCTVLDLAVRGYLRITEVRTTTLLFFSTKDYVFDKLREPDAKLCEHERIFMEGLFENGSTTKLSELRDKFYKKVPLISSALYNQLVEHGCFPESPQKVRNRYTGIALLAAAVPFVLVQLALRLGPAELSEGITPAAQALTTFASVVLTVLILGGFAMVMPAKTAAGSKAARQALGFKEFVERVERPRIERMAQEDPLVFERLLPFAVVLGVADRWAEHFRDLLTEPPSWYVSPVYGPGSFHPDTFVGDLGSGMHAMASTFISSPSSSGGGSGGGGFSGGGFGGGGGGGW